MSEEMQKTGQMDATAAADEQIAPVP